MNKNELDRFLCREIAAADAKVSLLMKDLQTGQTLHAYNPEEVVPSASVIKVPILLAVLQRVMEGGVSLGDHIAVPTHETLEDTEVFEQGACECSVSELLYWMIVTSDNTAANVLIGLVGFDAVNALMKSLGLTSTVLARRMLDFEAIRAGRNNWTSAADMARLYEVICGERILTPQLCRYALDILKRQRCQELFLRYIADDITVAHKTGGLDPFTGHDRVVHDAGVFLLGHAQYSLGIFVTGAPDDQRVAGRLIGRLSKAIYDCYKG